PPARRSISKQSRYTTTGVLEITPADNVALRLGVPHVPPTVMLENVEQFTAEQQHALAAFFKQNVSVRPITTASNEIFTLEQHGRFRNDLLVSLLGQIVYVPSLEVRKEDRESLLAVFLEEAIQQHGKIGIRLSK